MGLALFDWKTSGSTKLIVNASFSMNCLFDGYLTGATSYPHFARMAYLTGNEPGNKKTCSNALFYSTSLFDGYLTEH